jgi:hypothetical protein
MRVDGQLHAPAALPPGKRPGTHFIGGGPQGRSGRVRKISPPPGFDTRTVQPVASLYTDYAIPVHECGSVVVNKPYNYSCTTVCLVFPEFVIMPQNGMATEYALSAART